MPDNISMQFRDGALADIPGSITSGSPTKAVDGLSGAVKSALDTLDKCFRALLVCALIAELTIILVEIFSRFWFRQSLLWADEASKFFLSLIAFVGGALAYRSRHHTTVEFLTGRFSARSQALTAIGIDLLALVAAIVVGKVSLDLLAI